MADPNLKNQDNNPVDVENDVNNTQNPELSNVISITPALSSAENGASTAAVAPLTDTGPTLRFEANAQQGPSAGTRPTISFATHITRMSLWGTSKLRSDSTHENINVASSSYTPSNFVNNCSEAVADPNTICSQHVGGCMYYNSAPFTSQTVITPHVNPDSSIEYPHVPICTHCPPPSITVSEPAFTVRDLVEALRSNRKGTLPEWTLSKYDGDPLLWY